MALRDVNLVPPSVLERRYLARHGIGWAIAFGLLLALVLGGHTAYTRGVLRRRLSPTSEAQVRERLAAVIAGIHAKKEDLDRLASVRQVSRPIGAADVVGRLAARLDPGTWLTHLSLTTRAAGDTAIVMRGLALSNANLGAMIRSLTQSGNFRNVVLRDSSEVTRGLDAMAGPGHVVQFSVHADAVAE